MKKILSKFLKIGLPLALGVFLIWYSYSKFNQKQLEEIGFYFSKANYGYVLLAMLFTLLSHISRAYRWNFMLQPLGYKPKLLNNFMAISIAYLMNMFIPKSGEIARGMVLDKYENIPFEKGFGTIISERIVDLLMLLLFTSVAFALQYDVLLGYITEILPPQKMYIGLSILVVLGVLFLLFLRFSKSGLRGKLHSFISGLKDGVMSIVTMKKKIPFLLHTFLIWGLYILSFYAAVHALVETQFISMGTIITTFVVGSFAFAFSNGGFGSYPFFVAGILAVFGVPETVGTAFGWIVWTSNIASIILFGGLSFFMLPFYNGKNNIKTE